MRTMMITGDYHHTAIAVAKGAGMVAPAGKLVIIQAASDASPAAAEPSRQHTTPEHHSRENKQKQAVPQQVQCSSQAQSLRQQQLQLEQRRGVLPAGFSLLRKRHQAVMLSSAQYSRQLQGRAVLCCPQHSLIYHCSCSLKPRLLLQSSLSVRTPRQHGGTDNLHPLQPRR